MRHEMHECARLIIDIIRQMISRTSYLNEAGLQRHAADISEIESQKKMTINS